MATATPRPPRSRQEAVIQKVSSSVTFARIAPHLLPRLDKAVHRVSGGKVMLSQYMLPSLFLTTTGRRSGEPRVAPLACLPEVGGTFLVVGSNFGRTDHPAWTGNLLGRPEALVEHKGRKVQVTARLLEGEERAEAWAALLRMWPPYATYQARIDRQIRVFRLFPQAAEERAGA
ncbi:deazaflavin-dependent oxidoreductase (nitroreductase family) [Streptacidiphilus sp. MAP12-16]|jgi:deazaflavin-dependent oxidoreductase (nitroreductase family)|uniref:nitroreductase/quinone reductase family protein n=1 Tax=Streptacidiphilus sp. MAP12-16 TaxID=3156300 RepID=UPI003513DDA9